MFSEMIPAALLALTAENLLFAGGNGFSRALRSARRPAQGALFALFVALFSLASSLASVWLFPLLPNFQHADLALPVKTAVLVAFCYLIVAALLRAVHLYGKCAPVLAPAAVNTLVLAMPFLHGGFDAVQAAGYAVGTGVAFFIAVLVLSRATELCRNPDIPRAFQGLPAMLIYVGLLSMAFAGLTGKRVF